MHDCRVYALVDAAGLRRLRETSELLAPEVHAVTQWLEREHPAEDEEGLEYLALRAAVSGGVRARTTDTTLLVVAAADVSSDELDVQPPRPGEPTSRARLRAPIPLRRVVSLHVEEGPAGFTDEPDLLWYDVTELDEVVRTVS